MAGHGAGIVVRSMRLDDAPQLHDLARRAFSDLEKRSVRSSRSRPCSPAAGAKRSGASRPGSDPVEQREEGPGFA